MHLPQPVIDCFHFTPFASFLFRIDRFIRSHQILPQFLSRSSKLVNPKPFSSSTIALKAKVFNREFGDPFELTTEQVKTEVVDKFVYTAKYLFDAGFDGIQLHGAHGYLLAQFLSRTTNKRTDKYGGSVRNRAQVLVEIYNGIRQQVPVETGFIIGAKLNSVEFQNEGLFTDEAQEVAQTLDKFGFEFLELIGGTYETLSFKHRKESTIKREAYFHAEKKMTKM